MLHLASHLTLGVVSWPAQDGECDASPGGLLAPRCPPGTDWLDCDPCSSKEDGTCDAVTPETRYVIAHCISLFYEDGM